MTITLEIRPETEAALRQRAKNSGSRFEAFAASLLEAAVQLPLLETSGLTGQALFDASARLRGLFTDDEIDTMFSRNRSPSRPVHFE
jgi:hypothetical protein